MKFSIARLALLFLPLVGVATEMNAALPLALTPSKVVWSEMGNHFAHLLTRYMLVVKGTAWLRLSLMVLTATR